MELWVAIKLVLGNRARNLFPIVGVTIAVGALVMTLALGRGGRETIAKDLSAIGSNRILIGGEFTERDLKIVETIPTVEYGLFPGAREKVGNFIVIGYPEKVLKRMELKIPRGREVILDRGQYPQIEVGDFIDINRRQYRVIDTYIEKSPIETMRQGERAIIGLKEFNREYGRDTYNEMVVSFPQGESSEENIPAVIGQLKRYRGSRGSISILETPEVYKKVERVMGMVKTVLYTLSFISLALGGAGIMNMLRNSVEENRGTIGILRAQGVSKKGIERIFFLQGGIVVGGGALLGGVLGILGAYAIGLGINILPIFNWIEIGVALIISILLTLGIGIQGAKRASKLSTIEALKI